MRLGTRRGVVLIWGILLILIAVAFLGLGLDYGGVALMTKGQAITASENAGIAALSELYPPDYQSLGAVTAADWPSLIRQTETRAEAHDRAASHVVGSNVELMDGFAGPLSPNDPTISVQFGAVTPYNPDVQDNATNDEEGDTVLGRWEDSGSGMVFVPVQGAGQPTGFGSLPLASRIVIRRAPENKVVGLSEGDNPIAMSFGRGMFVEEVNTQTNAVTPFGVYRNRGIRLVLSNVEAMIPMGLAGAGAEVPISGGGTARVGVLPVAAVWRSGGVVSTWLSASQANPDLNQVFEIDNMGPGFDPTAEAFITNYGLDPIAGTFDPMDAIAEEIGYLENLGGNQLPPPQLALGDAVNWPNGATDAFSNQVRANLQILATNATEETWLLPLLREPILGDPEFRVVGFLRVYCVAVDPGPAAPPATATRTITLRVAPSGVPRTGIAYRDTDPSVTTALENVYYSELWRQTGSGDLYGPLSFGVGCAAVTVQYDHIQR